MVVVQKPSLPWVPDTTSLNKAKFRDVKPRLFCCLSAATASHQKENCQACALSFHSKTIPPRISAAISHRSRNIVTTLRTRSMGECIVTAFTEISQYTCGQFRVNRVAFPELRCVVFLARADSGYSLREISDLVTACIRSCAEQVKLIRDSWRNVPFHSQTDVQTIIALCGSCAGITQIDPKLSFL
jgi:hypothetical protein